MKLEKSVIFIVGTDLYQNKIALERIRREIFPKGSRGLNEDIFDSKALKLADVFDLANTIPMMTSKRLIVLRDLPAPQEKDQDRWLEYFKNPSPYATIVATLDKLDQRLKFSKEIAKKATILRVDPPKPREVPDWIRKIAKSHDVQILPEGIRILAESIGSDLARLDQEIEKLALYVHPEKKITLKAIQDLVIRTSGESVFQWTDELVEGRFAKSLTVLKYLLLRGESPLMLNGMLARHVRILLKARTAIEKRKSRNELPSYLGVPPFLVSRYLGQANRLSGPSLHKMIEKLQIFDRDLKSTGLPNHLLLERTTRTISEIASAQRLK